MLIHHFGDDGLYNLSPPPGFSLWRWKKANKTNSLHLSEYEDYP